MGQSGAVTRHVAAGALALSLITLLAWGVGVAPRSAAGGTTDPAASAPADLEPAPEVRLDEEVRSDEARALRQVVQQGVRLVKRGEYTEAIALLEPHQEAADFALLHTLGVAYVRTQRNPEAYAVLIRAHHLNPQDPGPLLPAAMACARMAKSCDEYRNLALAYKERGGKFVRLADKIAAYQPVTLVLPKRF
jgi:hypothetical protein